MHEKMIERLDEIESELREGFSKRAEKPVAFQAAINAVAGAKQYLRDDERVSATLAAAIPVAVPAKAAPAPGK